MKVFSIALSIFTVTTAFAQDKQLLPGKINAATPVKSQGQTGTCWAFSTTSLLESETLRKGVSQIDLSEIFTVRNIYLEKAKNYVRRQGSAQFGEGGLGHDVIRAAGQYGLVPEQAYSGLKNSATKHDHAAMQTTMKHYLDSIIKIKAPIPDNWVEGFTAIMDSYIGQPPASFTYDGKNYTPQTFAKEVVKFNPEDYVFLTSFTHHPFHQSFIVEVPDNFSNGAYYNVPLQELINITKSTLQKGYTIMWDADVSNKGWSTNKGYAVFPPQDGSFQRDSITPDMKEAPYSQELRQKLYEELLTQDDHLMHITGIEQTKQGKPYFVVKNSWGTQSGPFNGYFNVSEAYFAINTITIIVPKAALDKDLQKKIAAAR
ncbi:C1 family peptidase [Chitinophaga nivalis]|uniref:Aminopeptidase n=1 Tax=Chitinophaga nivalis TaxID=2991709 RepID=A0ABT3IPS3_9BACT|nr:C1 family peptidase [Chitinophaga nivalis]MCW3464340.1 C1 family peptidase [Chitinophaga nivalis]MCW3485969.1 C1 family peptidase [Chitinophaga nivalis]